MPIISSQQWLSLWLACSQARLDVRMRQATGIALAKQPTSTLLVYNDFRWETAPSDPEKHQDVDMFAREPRKDS